MVDRDPDLQQTRGLASTGPQVEHIATVSPEFAARKAHRNNSKHVKIWNILDSVYDPELPGLTIWDLGVLQDVQRDGDICKITVTPTYSGCPAVDTINQDIKKALSQSGHHNAEVKVVLSPAWTTDMMSPNGKAHLKSINIAPPDKQNKVVCPICNSENTSVISQFGSTACKSLYQCNHCQEAFDYFKHF